MALNGNELAERLISGLGIPESAQPNIRQMANIIVNYFKEKSEINIEDVFMQIDNVAPGNESKAVRKFGQKGRIE